MDLAGVLNTLATALSAAVSAGVFWDSQKKSHPANNHYL
jgi:hypothetical protein